MSAASGSAPIGPGGIATPSAKPGLLSNPAILAAGARVFARLARLANGPLRFGNTVIAIRHADVRQVLARDLDFRIGPVNAHRIEEVNGPFVLGMDRCAGLEIDRKALYGALAEVDLGPIRAGIEEAAKARVLAAPDSLDTVGAYARPIAAETARRLFGLGVPGAAALDETTFMDVARAVFAHTFLNLGDDPDVRARALRAAALMRTWIEAEIARRQTLGDPGRDLMGALLRQGALGPDGVRRALGGMLVGSIDTTATAVAKIVAVLGRDTRLLDAIAADVHDPDRLRGWCWEALRRWPHNPIVIRSAHAGTTLSGTEIHARDRVVAWIQAAMLDPGAFPDPARLRPDRPEAAYLHFGGGLHPCAGRAVNAFQIPALVGALVRRGITSVGPVAWAGPFPDRLVVRLQR